MIMMGMRTKIVATLGPASDSPDVVRALVRAGLSVARLNFSHGHQAEHGERIRTVRRIALEEHAAVAVLADLQGPRIRLGEVLAGTEVAAGATLILDGRRALGDAAVSAWTIRAASPPRCAPATGY